MATVTSMAELPGPPGDAEGSSPGPELNLYRHGPGACCDIYAGDDSPTEESTDGRADKGMDGCREYDRHLAEARRHNLGYVAATRALYLAGKDGRGRQVVVFSPDLVHGLSVPPCPCSLVSERRTLGVSHARARRRHNSASQWDETRRSDTASGEHDDSASSSPIPSRHQPGRSGVELYGSCNGNGGGIGSGGCFVASERSVGSAAVASLILYFVKLMDSVANRDYVVLLVCGRYTEHAGGFGDDADIPDDVMGEGDGSVSAAGWITWGRFSLLGQLHSLLPRRYKKNLAELVVLQPSPVLHTFFQFARLFLSRKFYHKLYFCESVAQLSERIPEDVIHNLPEAAIVNVPSTGSSDDPGGGGLGGDMSRPSPLHSSRVSVRGASTLGDDNWTPPPLPPPPLQTAPSPLRSSRGRLDLENQRTPGNAGGRVRGQDGRRYQRFPRDRRLPPAGFANRASSPSSRRRDFRGDPAGTNHEAGYASANSYGSVGGGSRSGRSSRAGMSRSGGGGSRLDRLANTPMQTWNSSPSSYTVIGGSVPMGNFGGMASVSPLRADAGFAMAGASLWPAEGIGRLRPRKGGSVPVSRTEQDHHDANVLWPVGTNSPSRGFRWQPGRKEDVVPGGVNAGLGARGGRAARRAGGRSFLSQGPSIGRRGGASLMSHWSSPRSSPRHGLMTPRTPSRRARVGSPVGPRRNTSSPSSTDSMKFSSAPILQSPTSYKCSRAGDSAGGPAPVTGRRVNGKGFVGRGLAGDGDGDLGGGRSGNGGINGGGGATVPRGKTRHGAGNTWGSPTRQQAVRMGAGGAGHSQSALRPLSLRESPRSRSAGPSETERRAKPGVRSQSAGLRLRQGHGLHPSPRRNVQASASASSPTSSFGSVNQADIVSASASVAEREVSSSHASRMPTPTSSQSCNTPRGTTSLHTISTGAESPSGCAGESVGGSPSSSSGVRYTGRRGKGSGSVAHGTPRARTLSRALEDSAYVESREASEGDGASGDRRAPMAPSERHSEPVGPENERGTLLTAPRPGATRVTGYFMGDGLLVSIPGDHRGAGSRDAVAAVAGTAAGAAACPTGWGGFATAVGLPAASGGSAESRTFHSTSSRIAPGIQALMAAHQSSKSGGGGAVGSYQAITGTEAGSGGKDRQGGSPQVNKSARHRNDAGAMRQALREHKESIRKAAMAASAAPQAIAEEAAVDSNTAGEKELAEKKALPGAGDGERKKVPPDPKGKVFGVPLVELTNRTPGADIPWVLQRFVNFLTKSGLDSVGLFRLAGDGLERAKLRDALDQGKQVRWDPDEDVAGENDCLELGDVNMVAQLLKAFFRELPEPLVPFSAYNNVVNIAKAASVADDRWVNAMKNILWGIPTVNYNCLRFLFDFLRKVAAQSGANRMTSENLAIVWAPNLIRPQDDDPYAILKDLRFQIETVRWMVDRFDELFDD